MFGFYRIRQLITHTHVITLQKLNATLSKVDQELIYLRCLINLSLFWHWLKINSKLFCVNNEKALYVLQYYRTQYLLP